VVSPCAGWGPRGWWAISITRCLARIWVQVSYSLALADITARIQHQMCVLLVSQHAPPQIGGVETIVLMEAKAFRDAGHEVAWITGDLPAYEPYRVVAGLRLCEPAASTVRDHVLAAKKPTQQPAASMVVGGRGTRLQGLSRPFPRAEEMA